MVLFFAFTFLSSGGCNCYYYNSMLSMFFTVGCSRSTENGDCTIVIHRYHHQYIHIIIITFFFEIIIFLVRFLTERNANITATCQGHFLNF